MVDTDIFLRYSGGSGNTAPGSSLGGAMSTAGGGTVDTGVANDLFDDVSSGEASAGDTEYRGIYAGVQSGATGTLADARIYHSSDSANSSDVIDMAIADEAVNVTMETIANESTAPVGPTFSHPTTYAGGIVLNSTTGFVANDERGVWVRRTITAAAPSGAITNGIRVEGVV